MRIGINQKRPMLSLRFWDRAEGWDSSVTIAKHLKTPKDWKVEGTTVLSFQQKDEYNEVLIEHVKVAKDHIAKNPGISAKEVKIYLESYIAEKSAHGEKSTFIKYWIDWVTKRDIARNTSTTKQKFIAIEYLIQYFASNEMSEYVTDTEIKFYPQLSTNEKKYGIKKMDGQYRKIKDVPLTNFRPNITKLELLPKNFEDWYMKDRFIVESSFNNVAGHLREGLNAAKNNLKIPDVVIFANDNRAIYNFKESSDSGYKNLPDDVLQAIQDLRPEGQINEILAKYIHAFQFQLETGLSFNDLIRIKSWPCDKPKRKNRAGQYHLNYSTIEKFGNMNVLWGYRAKSGAGMFIQPLSERAMEIWAWFQEERRHSGPMETPMRVTKSSSNFNKRVREALAHYDHIDEKYFNNERDGNGVSTKTGRHCKITRMVAYPPMLRMLISGHNIKEENENDMAKDHYIETKAKEISELQEIWVDIREMLGDKRKRKIFDQHYAHDAKLIAIAD